VITTRERTKERYDVHETPYGKAYAWQPGRVVIIECDCGEKLTFTSSKATCRCEANHAAVVREELIVGRLSGELSTPDATPGNMQMPG
jgi:hypothetical protein